MDDFVRDLLADDPLSPSVPEGNTAGSHGQGNGGAETSGAAAVHAEASGRPARLVPGSNAAKLQVARMALGKLRRQVRVANRDSFEQLGKYVQQVRLHGALRAGTTLAVVKKKTKRDTQDKRVKLMIRRTASHGKGRYQCIDAATRIKLAFDVDQRHKQLGGKFQMHPKTVARNALVISEMVWRCQLEWLDGILRFCEQHRPVSVCSSREWDETGEAVCLRSIGQGVAAHHEVDAVEVMVSSYRVVAAWKEIPTVLCFDINVPPSPLSAPAAPNIRAALTRHLLVEPLLERIQALQRLAAQTFHVNGADGASSNDRLHHFEASEANCAFDLMVCGNHQVHRVSLAVISSLGLSTVNDLYASSGFLSGHRRRLLHAVCNLVTEKLQVSYGEPPRNASMYAEAIKDFKIRTGRYFKGGPRRPGAPSTRCQTAWAELMAILNGCWWDSGGLVHFCRKDGGCCPGQDDQSRLEAALARTCRAILASILRVKPIRPADNKWAKLAPAFDLFMLGQAVHGVLGSMCKIAMGPWVAVYDSLAARGENGPEDAEVDVHYHKEAGARLRRLLQMMASTSSASAQKVLCILHLQEPDRLLNLFSMEASEGASL